METDAFIKLRHAPQRHIVEKLSEPNTLRAYRASPDGVSLQIRREKEYVNASLTFDEVEKLIIALRATMPERKPPEIVALHGLLAICPWHDANGKPYEQVALARILAPVDTDGDGK